MKDIRRKAAWLRLVALLVLVGALVQGMTWAGWLEKPESIYTDLWHQLAGRRYAPEHVAIVTLDQASLDEQPEVPLVCWTLNFARVIGVLRGVGAKVIGLDYLYYVGIEAWLKTLNLPPDHPSLKYDEPFKEQLASGQVIMAANMEIDRQQKVKVSLPLPSYFASLPRGVLDVGLVTLFTDSDGVIRRYTPAMTDEYGQVLLSFAKLLATRAAGGDPAGELQRLQHNPALKDWSADDLSTVNLAAVPLIGYVGPPGTFARLPVSRLLKDGAENDPEIRNLKGKVVLIAYEPTALQDIQSTPYSLSLWKSPGTDMSGVEVHANIVETLLTGKFPLPVPGYLRALYLVAALVLGGLLFYRLPSWRGLAAAGLMCLVSAAFAYLLFRGYWLLPTANVQLAVLFSYMGILGLRLTGEERERARIRNIFGRYVADEVVEKLLASGLLPDLGGESFQVTVLFSDIRNFIVERFEKKFDFYLDHQIKQKQYSNRWRIYFPKGL